MEYYYAKNGQQLGPVSVSELQDLLRQKQLTPTDLVWADGMSDWKPLKEVPGLMPVLARSESSQPATTEPASVQPAPGEPGVAKANAGSQFIHKAHALSLKALTAIKATAVATVGHLKQFVACIVARGRIRVAQREAVRQRAELGHKMYQAGAGDAGNRRIIDDIERKIRNAQAAGHSKRALELELQAAHAAIAEAALESDQAPAGAESEFTAAQQARTNLLAAEQAATDRRSGLRTMQSSQGVRIAIGYACVFLIISSMVLAARGTGVAKKAVPKGPQNVVDNIGGNQGGGGGDAGGGGEDGVDVGGGADPNADPGLVQNPSFSNEKSTCTFCFGTGQTTCTNCGGTAKRNCYMCNSTGRTPNGLQCFQCNGTGRQKCDNYACMFGKVQCNFCFGTGKR